MNPAPDTPPVEFALDAITYAPDTSVLPGIPHAEAVAEAIQQFRARPHRVRRNPSADELWFDGSVALIAGATVVDITPLYREVIARGEPFAMYEETVMRPPWTDAVFAYQQYDGAVILNYIAYVDVDDVMPEFRWQPSFSDDVPPEQHHTIDWDEVRWVALHSIWLRSTTGAVTAGPMHINRYAVAEDGTLIDCYWAKVFDAAPVETWGVMQTLMLKALTFLNCRNVTIVEPHRDRAQRRRIERAAPGVSVSELHLFPRGISVRGRRVEPGRGGVPLHSVRGHVAKYGPRYGRGLLFGKHEGEFWIPQHARGERAHGETVQDFTIEGAS